MSPKLRSRSKLKLSKFAILSCGHEMKLQALLSYLDDEQAPVTTVICNQCEQPIQIGEFYEVAKIYQQLQEKSNRKRETRKNSNEELEREDEIQRDKLIDLDENPQQVSESQSDWQDPDCNLACRTCEGVSLINLSEGLLGCPQCSREYCSRCIKRIRKGTHRCPFEGEPSVDEQVTETGFECPIKFTCLRCHSEVMTEDCENSLCHNCAKDHLETKPSVSRDINLNKNIESLDKHSESIARERPDILAMCGKCQAGLLLQEKETTTKCTNCKLLQCLLCHIYFFGAHICNEANVPPLPQVDPLANVPQSIYRCECTIKGRTVNLSCGHVVCALCFQQHVVHQCVNCSQSYQTVACPDCSQLIDEDVLFKKIFLGENEFYIKVEKAMTSQEQPSQKFDCLICFSPFRADDGLNLECDHKVCKICFSQYITEQIRSNKIDEESLSCPSHNCFFTLPLSILQIYLSLEDFEKLSQLRLESIFTKCPSGRCDYVRYINDDERYFICGQCNRKYCTRCKKKVKYEVFHSMVCNKPRAKEINTLEEFKSVSKPCPKCGESLVKEGGCNFVRCPSRNCQNQTNFCWLCSQTVSKESYLDHYPKNGPFGDSCLGRSKVG